MVRGVSVLLCEVGEWQQYLKQFIEVISLSPTLLVSIQTCSVGQTGDLFGVMWFAVETLEHTEHSVKPFYQAD